MMALLRPAHSGMSLAGLRTLLLGLLLLLGSQLAFAVQAIPALSARVMDQSGLLQAPARQALEDKLAGFEREHGSQLVVLIVDTTAPEDIAAYAWRVADQWKIGRRELGDGALLVVAKDDRTLRIEVARALEGAIPDLLAWRIIDRLITPAFRSGDFAGGINAGVDAMISAIKGEDLPQPVAGDNAVEADFATIVVLLFFFVPVVGSIAASIFGRKLGAMLAGFSALGFTSLLGGGLLLALVAGLLTLLYVLGTAFGGGGPGSGLGGGPGGPFSGSSGPVIRRPRSGGSSWGGSSGGGFRSGGGGSFGGGGASGRW